MCMADFAAYSNTQHEISDLYSKNKIKWNQMSLRNIAASGYFSADRSIADYANNIWNLKSLVQKTDK